MTARKILTPIQMGRWTAPNRVFMAPLTRTRATTDHVPTPMMVQHYADRAAAGLIIAEATIVSSQSPFYTEPGIYNAEQVAGWRAVTEAVHANQGRIFLQICHGGRCAHSCNNAGVPPEAASAIAISTVHPPWFNSKREQLAHEVPRELPDDELPAIREQFVRAARNAMEAGFDGVEIHAANAYLLDGFLRESANRRPPPYGGSIEHRARLLLEIVKDVCEAVGGGDRVAVRLSPINSKGDMHDSDPEGLTRYLCQALNPYQLAYLHIVRKDFLGLVTAPVLQWAREAYQGVLVGNHGYSPQEAEEAIEAGLVDAVAFGKAYLANPDLLARIEEGLPLNEPQQKTFYAQGEEGYNDYPLVSRGSKA